MTPLPLHHGAFFVSNTFLEWMQTCSRGAEHYKLDARVAAQEKAATLFGGHMHRALECFYRNQEFDLSEEQVHHNCLQVLEKFFSHSPVPEGDFRTINWAETIFSQYARKYQFETFELMSYKEPRQCKYCLLGGLFQTQECPFCNKTGFSSVMAEVPFVFKLYDHGDIPVYSHGFIDLVVSTGDLLYSLDWKSTSRLGNSFWDDQKVSTQHKNYAYGLQATLGRPVHGNIVRALRVLEPPQWVANGTANRKGEFKKLSEWWDESLPSETFYLGEGELEEWKQTAIELCEEFFWRHERGYFPKKTKWCHAKWRCQYWDVCGIFPPEHRHLLLNSAEFKDKEIVTPQLTKAPITETV